MRDTMLGRLDAEYIRRDGGNGMAAPLPLSGQRPTENNHAADKLYVDAETARAIADAQTAVATLQTLLLSAGGPLETRYDARYINTVGEMPGQYQRDYDDPFALAGAVGADRYTVVTPVLAVEVAGRVYFTDAAPNIDLSLAASWDAIAPDYRVAATRAGVDFYIYACQPVPVTDRSPIILISDNAAAPVGYTAANSRRIGGFHCLCIAAGVIGGHPLTNWAIGDVLPDSIWDYMHRPHSEAEGMVYSPGAHLWVDIYLQSGVGAATASVYNAVITDTRDWMDHVDDGAAVLKRLMADHEFQIMALGSNEETNIAGGADPVTTGGHVDTAARRMVSNIGCEDCCGAQMQWVADQSFRYDTGDHIHVNVITHKAVPTGSVVHKDMAENLFNALLGSGADETTDTSNVDPAPAWAQLNLPGARGSLMRQGLYGDSKVGAGGHWGSAADAGSRARALGYFRWRANAFCTARFCSEPRKIRK